MTKKAPIFIQFEDLMIDVARATRQQNSIENTSKESFDLVHNKEFLDTLGRRTLLSTGKPNEQRTLAAQRWLKTKSEELNAQNINGKGWIETAGCIMTMLKNNITGKNCLSERKINEKALEIAENKNLHKKVMWAEKTEAKVIHSTVGPYTGY